MESVKLFSPRVLEERYGGRREAIGQYYGFWGAWAYILYEHKVSYCNKSLLVAKKKLVHLKTELEEEGRRVLEVIDMEAQAL